MTTIGYARIFDQVTPHHQVSNHARSRRLSTWVRRDIDAMPVANSFIPMIFPREPWTSHLYEFPVPRVWADQLRLSPSELEFYADPLLLPPAKRCRVSHDAKPSQVIELRFPSGSEPLPTLCASYTNQHMLHIDHIRGKGIFAVLDQHARGVSFFDPAKFCSLFGACELIVLPSKLQEAFKCVGNAITVQHGLIPLLFGIQAVFKQPLDLHNLVKQSWNARLTSVNSIIFHQGDFVFIEKIEQAVIGFLSPQSPLEHQGYVRAVISIPCFFRDREFRVMATHKAPDLVARILSGPDDLLRQIYLRNEDERPNGQWTISMYAARASEWDIMLNAKTIGSIQLSQPELCEGAPSAPCFTEVISPTVPFAVCDDSPSKPAGAHDAFDDDFDVISATRLFRIFLQVIENHNTSATTATTSVQVRSIDLATTFVAQLPDDQCDGFLAALVDHITRAGGFCTRVGNTATTKYNIVCFGVDKCNLATCSTSCLVHSGGHHGYDTPSRRGFPSTCCICC